MSRARSQTFAVIGVCAAMSAALFGATPAQAASAGSARLVGDDVQFTAAPGHANNVVFTRSGNAVTVDDVVEVNGTHGCARVGTDRTKVTCTTAGESASLIVSLGDQNDVATNQSDMVLFASGEAGDDVLYGGSAGDSLRGDDGNDKVYGQGGDDGLVDGPGNDWLHGGAGDDVLNSAQGADTMIGGDGEGDAVYYGSRTKPVAVDLDGSAGDDGERDERDTVHADVEVLMGGSGNDVLTGNANANSISGGRGNDYIHGGAGRDDIIGNNGDDVIFGDAGDDHLIGENITDHHPDGSLPSSDTAKDVLDGGGNTPHWGDYCVVRKAGKTLNCESFDI